MNHFSKYYCILFLILYNLLFCTGDESVGFKFSLPINRTGQSSIDSALSNCVNIRIIREGLHELSIVRKDTIKSIDMTAKQTGTTIIIDSIGNIKYDLNSWSFIRRDTLIESNIVEFYYDVSKKYWDKVIYNIKNSNKYKLLKTADSLISSKSNDEKRIESIIKELEKYKVSKDLFSYLLSESRFDSGLIKLQTDINENTSNESFLTRLFILGSTIIIILFIIVVYLLIKNILKTHIPLKNTTPRPEPKKSLPQYEFQTRPLNVGKPPSSTLGYIPVIFTLVFISGIGIFLYSISSPGNGDEAENERTNIVFVKQENAFKIEDSIFVKKYVECRGKEYLDSSCRYTKKAILDTLDLYNNKQDSITYFLPSQRIHKMAVDSMRQHYPYFYKSLELLAAGDSFYTNQANPEGNYFKNQYDTNTKFLFRLCYIKKRK